MRLVGVSFLLILLCSCAAHRAPVPVGEVPLQHQVSQEDEQYGHEVLNMLTQDFALDRDDRRINRVRDLVDKLTTAANAGGNPWHVYVLVDDDFKNAAATRGNYIFVWTGLLRMVSSDGELATILAHEIGHLLAGHTQPTPQEEVNELLSGIAGSIAGQVVAAQGQHPFVADLAEMLARELLSAIIVNPGSQRNELEADQIGIFLMADAGIDPNNAISFWERARSDPELSGSGLQFLSSHPDSEERLRSLKGMLDLAMQRYRGEIRPGDSFAVNRSDGALAAAQGAEQDSFAVSKDGSWWKVEDGETRVFSEPYADSEVVSTLKPGEEVKVVREFSYRQPPQRWLQIEKPVAGYIQSRNLAPSR